MIPRHQLPQIPEDKLGEFIEFLKEYDIQSRKGTVSVSKLKPIQAHLNIEKLLKMQQDPSALRKPLLISKEGFVLDGHHRWAAMADLDPEMKANVIQCMCSIKQLVELGHQFDGSFTKTVHEATIYGERIWNDDSEEALPPIRKSLSPYQG